MPAGTRGPRASENARGRNHRLSRKRTRPSLRSGVNGCSVLSPVPGLVGHRRLRDASASWQA
jgi:hypothetical protein